MSFDASRAALEIMESEDDLIIREMTASGDAILVDDGTYYRVLALRAGEDPSGVASRHRMSVVCRGMADTLIREAERLRVIRDVMDS